MPIPDWARAYVKTQREQQRSAKPTGKPKPPPAPISAAPAETTPIDAAAQSLARAFSGVIVPFDGDPSSLGTDPPPPRSNRRTATAVRIVDGDPIDLWLPATQRWVSGLYVANVASGHAHLRGGRGPLAVPINHIRRSLSAPD